MLMKKLELENFRQYKGKQVIEFSEDSKKNVTLILGKNTSGKTTLIQAFRWVLYNDSNFTGRRNEPNNVLNHDVRKTMMPGDYMDAKATLTFTHQGMEYELSRKYEYGCKIHGEAHLIRQNPAIMYHYPNGEREVVRGAEEKLKEILPESLAEYFFFDGEKIAQSCKPGNVKDSINSIMGLVPLERMMNHLSKGGSINVESTLRSQLKKDSDVDTIDRNINICKIKIKEVEESKDKSHQRYQFAQTHAENKRIEMENIKDIAKYAAELKEVDRKVASAKKDIEVIEGDIIKDFAPAMAEAMINLISMDILKSISENEYDDKGVPGINATAIHYLLDNGKCICGANLNTSEECRAELNELLTYLPPESIGTQITHLRKNLDRTETAADKQNKFMILNEYYGDQLHNLEELESKSLELTDKVKDQKEADQILEEYKIAKSQRDQFQKDEVRYESEIQNLKKELDRLDSELTTAARADLYNQDILNKFEYVRALNDMAEKQYYANSEGIFDEIQKTLTEVFESMYHGSRNIELTPDYKVRLTVGGERLDNSKGLDTVQNFAFIASLLKVAKDRANLELSSEAYPLAMDAVFSNTDRDHIRNISKELPKLAEQAILAIMEKDWSVASPTLEEYVGKKYQIIKHSESYSEITEIKEVE